MDATKIGVPKTFKTEYIIQYQSFSNTDCSQTIQLIGNMGSNIEQINSIISYFGLLLYNNEHITGLQTLTDYNKFPTRKSPKQSNCVAQTSPKCGYNQKFFPYSNHSQHPRITQMGRPNLYTQSHLLKCVFVSIKPRGGLNIILVLAIDPEQYKQRTFHYYKNQIKTGNPPTEFTLEL